MKRFIVAVCRKIHEVVLFHLRNVGRTLPGVEWTAPPFMPAEHEKKTDRSPVDSRKLGSRRYRHLPSLSEKHFVSGVLGAFVCVSAIVHIVNLLIPSL